jgi:hypothetical protein
MIKEAREDTDKCIAFIEDVIKMLVKYKEGNKTEAEATPSNVQEGHTNEEIFAPKKGGGTIQPVRLRDCYPEPQRQVSQKRPPWKPPTWQLGTRRECNP